MIWNTLRRHSTAVCTMLRLAFCFLLAKAAFAANAYPVDGNYGSVGPDTNLVYNFEQIRSDQPPHVEMREENIHKYVGRPRTTPVPLLRSRPDNYERPKYPLPYNAMQWEALQKAPKYEGPTQNWKNVPAPPNFPHWESLSDLAATNPMNYESQPVVPQQPIVPEVPPQWSDPEVYNRAQNYAPPTSTNPPQMYAPMMPAMPSTMPPMRNPVPRHLPRGNHAPRRAQRDDWNDSMNMEPSSTTPAPTEVSSRKPPPAVPTLTPWYDGF